MKMSIGMCEAKTGSLKRLLIVCIVGLLSVLNSQTLTAQVAYMSREELIDSISRQVIASSIQQDSLRQVIRSQRASFDSLSEAHRQVSDELKNLKSELNEANGDRLQSSHTKSVLFIFNVVVGVFLLIALMWMFSRKKQESRSSSASAADDWREEEPLDHKLERIEKLGSLRDKGLLTEDEFNLQKKQILGDRG